jgi:hypothetical protein
MTEVTAADINETPRLMYIINRTVNTETKHGTKQVIGLSFMGLITT